MPRGPGKRTHKEQCKAVARQGTFLSVSFSGSCQTKGYLPVSCSTHRHAQKDKETSGAPGLLGYWATGLLGYWATEQSAGKKKFAFSSTCLVTPIYPERKRVWRSTLPGFCLLLTLFENLCLLAVFSCFCASNGTRGRLFPSYPLAFPIADCFRFLPFLFLKGFFFGFSLLRCRGLLSWQTSISQTPPLSWY